MLRNLFHGNITFAKAEAQLDRHIKATEVSANFEDTIVDLQRLLGWIDTEQAISGTKDTDKQIYSRLDFLFLYIEKNPAARSILGQQLRRCVEEARALDLLCSTGLPRGLSISDEIIDRLIRTLLPSASNPKDLRDLLSMLFPKRRSFTWISSLSPASLDRLRELFKYQSDSNPFAPFISDSCDAIIYLTGQIQTMALDPVLRHRMENISFRESPFYELTIQSRMLVDLLAAAATEEAKLLLPALRINLKNCHGALDKVHEHLSKNGVSVSTVYQINRIRALLDRLHCIFAILLSEGESTAFSEFFSNILRDLEERQKLRPLIGQSFSLLSQKIAEQNAETGDHYIARNRRAYFKMFLTAAGGGVVTAFTVLIRITTEAIQASYFVKGVLGSLNYAGSFVFIQLCGFTLGTKQPAMTANALATQMRTLEVDGALEKLVDEIKALIRSQTISVVGNVLLVIPTAIAIDYYFFNKSGAHLLDSESATKIFKDHSILGISLFAAAWTGVLLWFSSICAGWIDNWSRFRMLDQAIGEHRRLRLLFGRKFTATIGRFYSRKVSGFAGNITLGFLLGMTPKIASFVGLPLEVRHVTLASGSLAVAFNSLGLDAFKTSPLWLAIGGIIGIGIINISVSFSLALTVALQAQNVSSLDRRRILSSLGSALRSNPGAFFFPPKGGTKISDLH